jgi:hypothetical protein
MKTPYGLQTDHINRNKLDNRKCNLRIVNCSQNKMNIKLRSDNSSGVKGVYFDKQRKKWVAEIMLNKKKFHLGRFNNIEEAKLKRKFAEKQYFGEYASN